MASRIFVGESVERMFLPQCNGPDWKGERGVG